MFHQDVVETLLALAPEPMQLCGRVPAQGLGEFYRNTTRTEVGAYFQK